MKVSPIRKLPAERSVLSEADARTLDDVADVLYFLHHTEPLHGCDYSLDETLVSGRNRIIQWLERGVRSVGEPAAPAAPEVQS